MQRSERRLVLLVLATGLLLLALWAGAHGAVPYDFRIYRHAGDAVLHGRSPYPHLPLTEAVRRHHPFVYPPPAAWFFVPFALLGFWLGAWLLGALSIASFLLGTWWLGVRSVPVYLLVLTSSVVLRGLTVGTIDGILFLGICALVRFRDRPRVAATAFVLLVAFKPLMLPLVVYLLVTGRMRAVRALLVAGAVLVAASLASGFSVTGYVQMLRQLSTIEAPDSWGVVAHLVRTAGWSVGAATIVVSVICGLLLLATLAAGLRGRLDHRVVLAVSVGSALLVSPIVWSHYAAFCWAPLLLLQRTTLVAAAGWLASWLLFPAPMRQLWLPGPLTGQWVHALAALVPIAMIVAVVVATSWPATRRERSVRLSR